MAIEIDNRIGEASGHDRVESKSEISSEASRFAETHGMKHYLVALNSTIMSHTELEATVRVELDSDPIQIPI